MDTLLQPQGSDPTQSPVQAIAASSGVGPQPYPKNARLINLRPGSKAPASSHGHHDALPQEEFVPVGDNVGIVLDGMFLVVDIDHEDNDAARHLSSLVLEEGPRVHKTPRGRHFFFGVPHQWSGTNKTLRDNNGSPYGDIKTLGYVVGPGSKVDGVDYSVVHDVEPPEAPQWLLDLASKPARAEVSVEERTGIPYGEHDAFLVRLAGYLRGREGLAEEAIRGVLEGGPLAALESYDDTRPYTERDLNRIAHSASRWEPRLTENIDLLHPSVESATNIELVGPTIEWVVRGFVPRGELVLMYGPGGIGKSSMGSWLGSECNRQGLRFCYMGTEEPPARFFGRAVLAGAKRSMCLNMVNPAQIRLPRDASILSTIIQESNIDFLYIDSIYSHFERKEGDNAAERARDSLAPLLAIAHATGCTIFGVFHTNKAGAFLGSTEMENVARCLLEAKRKSSQGYLGIKVHKTNLYNPGKMMRLEGREEIFRDEQGNVQLERDEDGKEIPLKIIVPARIEDVDDDGGEAPMDFDQDEIGELPIKDRIREYMSKWPEDGPAQIARELGVAYNTAKKYFDEN